MYLMGIADEAGVAVESQIRATKTLGWKYIEARNIQAPGFPPGNLHDIPDAAFECVAQALENAGIGVYCFGSAIANWGKKIDQPFEPTLAEVRRAIPRMQRLGSRFIRIMSFAIRETEDQMEDERFRRLREITAMFLDAGLQPVHENCMNYGGMGWPFTLKLLEAVPGLKLVFDTGNPVFNNDRSKPVPYPKQDPWEFFHHVREHIVHVHVKDLYWAEDQKEVYTYPGEGKAEVRRILTDLLGRGYGGGISIEPHLAVVFHDASIKASEEHQFNSYVEYGRRLVEILDDIQAGLSGQRL